MKKKHSNVIETFTDKDLGVSLEITVNEETGQYQVLVGGETLSDDDLDELKKSLVLRYKVARKLAWTPVIEVHLNPNVQIIKGGQGLSQLFGFDIDRFLVTVYPDRRLGLCPWTVREHYIGQEIIYEGEKIPDVLRFKHVHSWWLRTPKWNGSSLPFIEYWSNDPENTECWAYLRHDEALWKELGGALKRLVSLRQTFKAALQKETPALTLSAIKDLLSLL